MQIIENNIVNEKLYIEKLENGLTVMVLPRKNIQKKYAMVAVNYGSLDNEFIIPGEKEKTVVPDGVAHFLEHKMFEQENGRNSLDVLSALGVEANAYTTTNHTAFLFECTDNYYEALDELLDYVQHPYFTDENVQKEKGIIDQEIMMYDDTPDWIVYMNVLKAMYKDMPININITGTVETVDKIDKDILYKCYHTFYNLSNMVMFVAGDFDPNTIFEEVNKRIVSNGKQESIKRIYPKEQSQIVQSKIEAKMGTSIPIFAIGIKDKCADSSEEIVKKYMTMTILLNVIVGKSSKLYKRLYEDGVVQEELGLEYECSKLYGHALIMGASNNPEKILKGIEEEVSKLKKEGINANDFERNKKLIYGRYIKEYNNLDDIATMFVSDYMNGINSFDYINIYDSITKDYAQELLNSVFDKEKTVISIVK